MKVLVVSTLYPNAANPKHGIFVHHRMKQLRSYHPEVELKVIAPVPWFPIASAKFGDYGRMANVPLKETIDGIEVYHPRYLVIPKLGMHLTPFTLAQVIRKTAQQIRAEGFDYALIDGHYYYPDGVAIERACRRLNVPFTMTARGTDINYIPEHYPLAKRRIQQVFSKASRNMAVCQALLNTMTDELGANKATAVTARNGVDLELFAYADDALHQQRKQEKQAHSPTVILSVGHLIERKGHHLIIDAIKDIADCELWILGAGPLKGELEAQIERQGLQSKVRLLGEMTQPEMIAFYQAADLMVLASSREGWANVLLEAMACGTPVVATRIWGTPEVMAEDEQQFLCERTVPALAHCIQARIQTHTARATVRAHAEQFSWHATSDLLKKVWAECVAQNHS